MTSLSPIDDLLERVRSYAMPKGAVEYRGAWLRQEGEMRFTPERRWMTFTAEQWFPGRSIDFRWRAWLRMAPFVGARVDDSFQSGLGTLSASLFGFIPIARSRGPATDKGEALRALAELPWRPFVFGGASGVTWEAAEEKKLLVGFNNGKTKAEIVLNVDQEGRVLGGVASGRPRIVGKSFVETPWSGIFGEYRVFRHIRIPTAAEAVWHLSEGPFTYWRARVTDFHVF